MQAGIYPMKGQYLPGENITLRIDCGEFDADRARVSVYSLGRIIKELDMALPGRETDIILPSPGGDLSGFGVKAAIYKDSREIAALYTAFDVSLPGRVVRYGFLSDFGESGEDGADVCAMAKYHINTVQFYDWSYRPDEMIAHEDGYMDIMGKENRLSVVRKKAAQCHERGMRAVGYGAVYAASKEYRDAHPEQSLFAGDGTPLCFIGKFYIMDISGPWRGRIISQYKAAAEAVGFDGIHMDTYGFPKAALNSNGNAVYLEDHFNALIEDTGKALTKGGEAPCLIFNNVGGWPMDKTKHAPQECVYIEVWPPCERYHHLKQLILDAKQGGKPAVLAAYPASFRTDTPERALESELLCSLAIAINGATQLFIGEENAVITQGYYADYTRLDDKQIQHIRAYQDFFVQYAELLFDDNLADVSMTHIGGDNAEYACGASYSVSGESGRLWLNIRENKKLKVIGMVNLCGNDDFWNKGKNEPCTLHNVGFSILTVAPAVRVWYASPDTEGGMARELPFRIESTDKGETVHTAVPAVKHGGILWMEV